MIRLLTLLLFFGLLSTPPVRSQSISIQPLLTGTEVSFRALSVVSDEIVWASGTKGTVVTSVDGGNTWRVHVVEDMPQADFRALYAFDERIAMIANAGSPGKILRTEDGGSTWATVYVNTHPDVFIDGIDFWNEREGIVYGDPLGGRMLLLQTRDGGRTWRDVTTSPQLEPGEASFAASGTGIRCRDDGGLLICTGGKVTRLWHSPDQGKTWNFFKLPLTDGSPSTGAFSVGVSRRWIVVGGDYQNEDLHTGHYAHSDDRGKSWQTPKAGTRGYRECVEHLGDATWIAVGPSGLDVSTDDGNTWTGLSDIQGLHVARKSRKGNRVIAAGSKGAIYRLR